LSILDKINCSNDIKALSDSELVDICSELRQKIVQDVSQTGGHLASNLGAVELTVALHKVYDTSRDRIVFDVGHQCYAHKIITGRRDRFCTLRQTDGISGFPKPREAKDDAFIAGHASNSVAVALGMARARTLMNEKYDVVAVLGDGALTGGLAYEGLENAAVSNEPMVIILNDNGMSISGNVGGMDKILSAIRVKEGYLEFKRYYRETVGKVEPLYNFNHKVKEAVKRRLIHGNLFDDLGLYYLGPVDGHDVGQLITALQWAKDLKQPVLLHVITTKGKGCDYAEADPSKYHGVGKFDPQSGKMDEPKMTYSDIMGETLCKIASKEHRVVGITAAMTDGTGLKTFSKKYPSRFYDVGISEGCAVSMAAGMSKQGLIPVVAIYSSFLQRAYDMMIHDVSLQNLHVVFCVDRAGLVGNDGETHHGLFDVSYLRSVPGMTVLCPSNYSELERMLEEAVCEYSGPVAIRYPRGTENKDCTESRDSLRNNLNSQATIVTYGAMYPYAVKACELVRGEGIDTDLIKLDKIAPLDIEPIAESVRETKNLLVIEDVISRACVGEEISSRLNCMNINLNKLLFLNYGNGIVRQGANADLMKQYGMDPESIAQKIKDIVK